MALDLKRLLAASFLKDDLWESLELHDLRFLIGTLSVYGERLIEVLLSDNTLSVFV